MATPCLFSLQPHRDLQDNFCCQSFFFSSRLVNNECSFKFDVKVGVEDEKSIVNALYGSRISCLNLTLLHKRCVLNGLSNTNFDAKLKKKQPFTV
jgi:hypothetical protein